MASNKLTSSPLRPTILVWKILSSKTPAGGRIRARVRRQDEQVHCTVSDNGVGMSAEEQAQLFTKFFRAEAPGLENIPGTGLGLCIVKNLVELQGGEIKVKSEPGRGSTFAFTLPAVLKVQPFLVD